MPRAAAVACRLLAVRLVLQQRRTDEADRRFELAQFDVLAPAGHVPPMERGEQGDERVRRVAGRIRVGETDVRDVRCE